MEIMPFKSNLDCTVQRDAYLRLTTRVKRYSIYQIVVTPKINKEIANEILYLDFDIKISMRPTKTMIKKRIARL